MNNVSVRASSVKSNDMTKYVELYVEDLRTRVRFPPVPPIKKKPTLQGWFFLPATAYLRGFLRTAERAISASNRQYDATSHREHCAGVAVFEILLI